MSEMCCTRLAENTGRKKSPFWHHRTTLLLVPSQLRHVSTIGKNLNTDTLSILEVRIAVTLEYSFLLMILLLMIRLMILLGDPVDDPTLHQPGLDLYHHEQLCVVVRWCNWVAVVQLTTEENSFS